MRLLAAAALAGAAAFVLDLLVAAVALRVTGVPRDFPPFSALPILSGAAGGALGAALVYALLRGFARQPDRAFLFTVLLVLALSFLLPVRLSFTRSSRFAGVTPAAQAVLALMHTVVAASAVVCLTRARH